MPCRDGLVCPALPSLWPSARLCGVVTDVGRLARTSTLRPIRSARRLRWVVAPTMALVAVCSFTLISSSGPALADGVGSAKAKAKALYQEIQSEKVAIGQLTGQYDEQLTLARQLHNRIDVAQHAVARDEVAVSKYQSSLQSAAVNAYVNIGSVASTNPIFATNANALGATSIY